MTEICRNLGNQESAKRKHRGSQYQYNISSQDHLLPITADMTQIEAKSYQQKRDTTVHKKSYGTSHVNNVIQSPNTPLTLN